MEHNSADTTQVLHADAKAIDAWLKSLWDKVKKAAELISQLREEKAELQARVASLESDLARIRQQLSKDEDLIQTLSAERGDARQQVFTNGEREQLSVRVRDLLAKLDPYI